MSQLELHVVGERKARYRCPNCERSMSYTGTFLPPLRATCRGCATTVHFEQSGELIPLDEHVGETITLTVSFGDERLSELRELAQREFGLDLARNPEWLLDLAAIALTLQVWRNSPIEDIQLRTHDAACRPSGPHPQDEPTRFATETSTRLRLNARPPLASGHSRP